MNDIEYIIFDDNHRAIMENGVSPFNAHQMNDEIERARWLCVVIAAARECEIKRWFIFFFAFCVRICRYFSLNLGRQMLRNIFNFYHQQTILIKATNFFFFVCLLSFSRMFAAFRNRSVYQQEQQQQLALRNLK